VAQIGFQVANLSKDNYKSVAKELYEVLTSLEILLLGSRQRNVVNQYLLAIGYISCVSTPCHEGCFLASLRALRSVANFGSQ
jgi:hypothetical protein